MQYNKIRRGKKEDSGIVMEENEKQQAVSAGNKRRLHKGYIVSDSLDSKMHCIVCGKDIDIFELMNGAVEGCHGENAIQQKELASINNENS